LGEHRLTVMAVRRLVGVIPKTESQLTPHHLAVSAHQNRAVESAAASAPDAVFTDFEVTVPLAEKEAAIRFRQTERFVQRPVGAALHKSRPS
jgi:hypothetical protein